ncbi:hypothetical protein DEU56DRAFT_596763 [Suillus clintonianus]|uniref:uncharacterized protein n=1 Tax=Suillus clintonianus TaxID=1904413 RepID=UPI001B865BEE|nr:uncharacterized protein DEU56DRAFT_596763 [Suillus clintonianus]KAG2124384.1 hypothetical protein DEU56DRAFT_596763 [Suillus clintonianus]
MQKCTPAVVIFILGIVMIIRLHAMYQGSRKMLNFLVIAFLALMFLTGVLLAFGDRTYVREMFILNGAYTVTYQCLSLPVDGDASIMIDSDLEYVTGLAWEVLALCLAVWIVIKHFCELQRQPRGWNIKDCFTVLIQTHVLYFVAFALTSSLKLGNISQNMMNDSIVLYEGFIQIVTVVQLFVLGPRLILSVRVYHYQLLADSDEGTAMTAIAFQECSRESIGSDV